MSESKVPTCSTSGCEKPGTMQCPTCIKLNIPGSFFCSQDCFKTSWKQHKGLHKMFKQAAKAAAEKKAAGVGKKRRIPDKFDGYKFTGPLRPGKVSAQMTVPSHIAKPDYASSIGGASMGEESARSSKIVALDEDQRERMRKAGRIGREVMDAAREALRAGVTGDDVDQVVYKACVERVLVGRHLTQCDRSANEVICHGIPDSRVIEDGDIVNLDVTVYIYGVHADLNETFFIGDVDADSRMLVKTAFNCLKKAIDMVRPGTMYRDLGTVISKTARKNRCSVVTSYCGHGCHELFHTAPNVPHYSRNKAVGTMKVGHSFTIEPMINRGASGDQTWPDGWTAVTQDGSRSAQFEHTILCTETGYELVTARVGQPTMVWDEEYTQRPGRSAAEKK